MKKRHVIAMLRDIDGEVRMTFCGRIAGTEDSSSQSEVVDQVRKGWFRAAFYCRLCLRAPELNELVYAQAIDEAEAC